MKKRAIVVSCEHAGKRVPAAYQSLFTDAESVLASHRGWDPGALSIAQSIAQSLDVHCHHHDITRLLIEPNRSLSNPQLFSAYTQCLNEEEKQTLIDTYYTPYRTKVQQDICKSISRGIQVVHLSIHSFTPIWNGQVREVEIGLLFDDKRKNEFEFSQRMRANLEALTESGVCFNQPYLGTDDGFTTYLRTLFSDEFYIGVEIEINQRDDLLDRLSLCQHLIHAINSSI